MDPSNPVTDEEARSGPHPVRRAAVRLLWGVLLLFALALAGYAALAASYLRSLRRPDTIAGLRAAGQPVGGTVEEDLQPLLGRIGDPALDEAVILVVGEDRVRATRREVGILVDVPAYVAQARRAGKTGNPLADVRVRRRALAGQVDLPIPFRLDRQRALEFLTDLKEWVDRAPVDAHLDLEHHRVAPAAAGRLLDAYESLANLEDLARLGTTKVTLRTITVPPRVASGDLDGIDISTVLATWETRYSATGADSDRTFNLKVGASKLDGHILRPHEVFSFNEVVGERTEKQGYRVAPVISSGELIDGLAGGMCQIASTLHAAAFFAGFDIVSTTPHSRPSAYIPLGLDSTVVWPSTDLKIRNPFDFPVVMHYTVNQGQVRVELLGRKKPYTVVFEREITEERKFGASSRTDKELPKNQKYVAQEGYPGYHAYRRRYLFDAAAPLPKDLGKPEDPITKVLEKKKIEPVRVDKWSIYYPATEQITVVGGAPPSRKKKQTPPSHHIPPVPADAQPFGRIVQ